jgi:hypothetical protein
MESSRPASVLGILRDPANDKLTDKGRATVHEFYRSIDAPRRRPTTGSTTALLAEQRELCDDNTAIAVTQTQLKLDYAQNAATRVKTKKRYKLKGESQSHSRHSRTRPSFGPGAPTKNTNHPQSQNRTAEPDATPLMPSRPAPAGFRARS